MNKIYNYIVLFTIVIMSLFIWFLVKYLSSGHSVKITDDYIGKLNINKAVDELHNRGNGFSKEQYKYCLIGMAVYSNLKSSDLKLNKDNPNIAGFNNFLVSFKSFIFSREKGVSYVLTTNEDFLKHVKEFLTYLVTFSKTFTLTSQFEKYLDLYGKFMDTAYKNYDEKVVKILTDNKLDVTIENKKKIISFGDFIFGSILVYLSKIINFEV